MHTAIYTKPLIAHGSIGPSCGVAVVTEARVEVWTHSQNVFALRAQIARVLNVSSEIVRVRHMLAAGCYGHNGADDAAMGCGAACQPSAGPPCQGPMDPQGRADFRAARLANADRNCRPTVGFTDFCLAAVHTIRHAHPAAGLERRRQFACAGRAR
ncbi:molybdopterin-dependent oxidoreductase [Bradyrhizobium sp. NBAIM08]|nr:molybdopterin-dependent oxidoreductase [Bradyrhizobium sp. NBAIM08]